MPYKLLLADDSVTIQRVIELTFADEDVQVTAVGDGRQAIDRIMSDRPDIVLADVGMPGQDGYEVAAFIKDDPSLAHIPVLLLTGAFEPVDEERAREVRCDGVLAKPFEPQLLIGRVKELLRSAAPARDDAAHTAPAESDVVVSDGVDAARAAGFEMDLDGTANGGRPAMLPPEGDDVLEVEALDMRPDPQTTDGGTLDDYFDRLDAAFANLTGAQPGRDVSTARPVDPWTAATRVASAWPESTSPAEALDQARKVDSPSLSDALDASAPLTAVEVPDAFAALLKAEREHGPDAVGGDGEPQAVATVLLPGTPVTPALIDEVARRVIERLGEAAFREVVTEVVSSIAERLIREEIERIKASI